MNKYIVTGTSMVVEAETPEEAVDRAQDSSGWHWEAEEVIDGTPARIVHRWPNGTVNATVTLTFSAGGVRIAQSIAEELQSTLTRLAGTAHVPAVVGRHGPRAAVVPQDGEATS